LGDYLTNDSSIYRLIPILVYKSEVRP